MSRMACFIWSRFSCCKLTFIDFCPLCWVSRATPFNSAGRLEPERSGDGATNLSHKYGTNGFAVVLAVEHARVEVPPVVDEGDEVGHESAGGEFLGDDSSGVRKPAAGSPLDEGFDFSGVFEFEKIRQFDGFGGAHDAFVSVVVIAPQKGGPMGAREGGEKFPKAG